jgi:DNA-binding NarL/FixJ family response regulator
MRQGPIMIADRGNDIRKKIKGYLIGAAIPQIRLSPIYESRNYEELIQQIKEHDSSLTILSYELPGLKGFEGIEELQGDYPKTKLFLIGDDFMSDTPLELRAHRKRIDCLTTPFSFQSFDRIIMRLFGYS